MNSSKFQQIIYRWKKDKSCNLKWLSVEKFVLQHSWLVHIPRGYVLLSGVAFCTVWCKMTPIISVPQAHMDVAVLLRKNVYRPLEEVAVHKQTQTHKLNGYRDQLEETMDKVEHDLQVVSNCDVIFVKPGQVSLLLSTNRPIRYLKLSGMFLLVYSYKTMSFQVLCIFNDRIISDVFLSGDCTVVSGCIHKLSTAIYNSCLNASMEAVLSRLSCFS